MSGYEYKYRKYKAKYLMLKGGKTTADTDTLKEIIKGEVEDDENDILEDEDVEDIEDIEDNQDLDETLIGFDDKIVTNANEPKYPYLTNLPEDEVEIHTDTPTESQSETKPVDIGLIKSARGVIREKFNYEDRDFITLKTKKHTKKKILSITTISAFDDFTDLYGFLNSSNQLYIDWDRVSKKYKGFYLDESLNKDKFDSAWFKGSTYVSWWVNEFPYKGVILFVKN